MKELRFYLRYAVRSLWRERQRTVFTIICIIVGVTSVVALQTQSVLVREVITTELHQFVGGDIVGSPANSSFGKDTIARLDQLKKNGTIGDYTIVRNGAGAALIGGASALATVQYVDPAVWPLYGSIHTADTDQDIKPLLTGHNVIVSRKIANDLGLQIGTQLKLSAVPDPVTVVGIVADDAAVINPITGFVLAPAGLIDITATSADLNQSSLYVKLNQGQDETTAVNALKAIPEIRRVDTLSSITPQINDALDWVNTILIAIGFFALLIGGVGVVNSMLVLIGRRVKEIATLKTLGLTGPRVLLLFSIEAGVLGLLGSIFGTIIGVALSYFVSKLISNFFLVFHLDWHIVPSSILSGLFIGITTTIIFGLLPAITASRTEPAVVLRTEASLSKLGWLAATLMILLTTGLMGGVLYIMTGNLPVSMGLAFGTLVVAGLLTLVFSGLIWLMARIPSRWLDLRLALRALDRQKRRTAIIMLTLTIGIFGSSSTLILAQDFRQNVNQGFGSVINFNLIVTTGRTDVNNMINVIHQAPGYEHLNLFTGRDGNLSTIKGQPAAPILRQVYGAGRRRPGPGAGLATGTPTGVPGTPVATAGTPTPGGKGADNRFNITDVTLAGRDFSQPSNDIVIAPGGRVLDASDATKPNILVNASTAKDLSLNPGDQIVIDFPYVPAGINPAAHDVSNYVMTKTVTLTIVGIASQAASGANFSPSPIGGYTIDYHFLDSLGTPVGGTGLFSNTFTVQIARGQEADATHYISNNLSNTFVLNIGQLLGDVNNILDKVTLFPLFLAFLALFAGAAMIGNNVAITVLERKRELAVMKAVGARTSKVLFLLLLENLIVGLVGGLIGVGMSILSILIMVHFAGARGQLPIYWDKQVIIGLILLAPFLAVLAAFFSAFNAAREKPVELLRYE